MSPILAFTFLLALLQLPTINCQRLNAVEIATIPHEFYGSTVFYDGDEWIYTFHTVKDDGYHPQLWRLSVSNFTLEKVAEYTNFMNFYGYGAHINETAYFFGDTREDSSIVQFKLDNNSNSTELLTPLTGLTLPLSMYGSAITYQDEVYIFCSSYCSGVYKFFPENQEITQVTEIPMVHRKSQVGSVRVEDKVYVFGIPLDYYNEDNHTYSVFNLKTYEYEGNTGNNLDYLKYTGIPAATTDGKFIYLIPSHENPATARVDGLYQIDPKTHTNQFLPVADFPVNNPSYFYDAPASIYVEKVNGIFMFGGVVRELGKQWNVEYLKQIYFIDMSPLNPPLPTTTTLKPDLFTCANHTDGELNDNTYVQKCSIN